MTAHALTHTGIILTALPAVPKACRDKKESRWIIRVSSGESQLIVLRAGCVKELPSMTTKRDANIPDETLLP